MRAGTTRPSLMTIHPHTHVSPDEDPRHSVATPDRSARTRIQSLGQECTDRTQRLVRGRQCAHARYKAMRHALPNIASCINPRIHGARDIAQSVIKQYFVIAHLHADRRKTDEVTEEWGSLRLRRIGAIQVGADKFTCLRFDEVRVSNRAGDGLRI